jgi:predicted oxidoreductase
MSRSGQVIPTETLLQEVWGYPPGTGNSSLVRMHVLNLRRKIEQDPKSPKYLRPLSAAPYSALNVSVGKSIIPAFTLGGLETLPTGEVLTPDGKPVPGLYAAGRTTAGLPHSASGYASGLSIADGSFFGRQAGRSAARAKAW